MNSAHERKRQTCDRAGGPNGAAWGLDTLAEMITWRQFGFRDEPIVWTNHRDDWPPGAARPHLSNGAHPAGSTRPVPVAHALPEVIGQPGFGPEPRLYDSV